MSDKDKKDFFVSYNQADKPWAEWIAWQLEDAGYSTIIQAWDFAAGGNFVVDMHAAAANARRTIAVLSRDYLAARFTQPEWAAAFAQDPTGEKRLLVPVRVADCQPRGLLGPVVYVDLLGLDQQAARQKLLAEVSQGRRKPRSEPGFPGGTTTPASPVPEFPGLPEIVHQESPAPQNLVEISLVVPEPEGLYPLDFAKLVANWPRPCHLTLAFVDRDGQPLTAGSVHDPHRNWQSDDVWRLALRTFADGYLLLLSRGSSGKYYLLAPNPSGIGVARLPAGNYLVPGLELLPLPDRNGMKQEMHFQDPGEEAVLAVLSRQPWLADAPEVFSPCPEARAAELLAAARRLPGTEVGLATITVNQ